MVLDTSAIVAVHRRETDFERLVEKIDSAPSILVGIPTVFETAMVLSSQLRLEALPSLFSFLRTIGADLVPFDERHLESALQRSDTSGAVVIQPS